MSYKQLSALLTVVCVVQTWRACNRPVSVATATAEDSKPSDAPSRNHGFESEPGAHDRDVADDTKVAEEEPPPGGASINGFRLPAWTLYFAPMPGESMLSYRDRMLPLAQAAIAPHRSRVARGRDDFAAAAHLDSQQRASLDAAVTDASRQIEDRVMNALMSGDLQPATFKPMTGVTLARDVLDTIDKANQKFVSGLREDQKAQLAQHPFDFADYLLFSARWEDALGVTN